MLRAMPRLAPILALTAAAACAAPQDPGGARTGYIAANAFDGAIGGLIVSAIAVELWFPKSQGDTPLTVGFIGGGLLAGFGSSASGREPTRVEVGLIYAVPLVLLTALIVYARKL
jgi:hypothetical protein